MLIKLVKAKKLLTTLLVLGMTFTALQLNATQNFCSKIWSLNPFANSTKKIQVSNVEFMEPSPQWISLNELKGDSVKFTATRQGKFGQVFTLERKEANNWQSHIKRTNLQGDPRMILQVLGDGLANRLGFSVIDKKSLQYPSAYEFSQRLKELLHQKPSLRRFFPLRFHSEDKTLSLYSYLNMLAHQSSIPLSPRGHGLIHDLNWHSLSPGLLSPTRLENLRNSLKLFIRFIDFVNQQKYVSNWERKKIEDHMENLSYATDNLLGAPISAIYYKKDLVRLERALGAYFTHRPQDALPNSPRLYHLFLENYGKKFEEGKPNPRSLTEEVQNNFKLLQEQIDSLI